MTRQARALTLRRVVPAPPTRVFTAWTDPTELARWMTPIGQAEAEVDLREGGRFRIVMRADGTEITHTGEYLEIRPPDLLSFTWVSPYTGQAPSVVTVRLTPVGDGTEIELTHDRLPHGVDADHARGWGSILDRLANVLEEE